MAEDPADDRIVLEAWLTALDEVSYYDLLGVAVDATFDDVRAAFHRFAERFHPDGHLGRPAEERDAVGRIFRRGAEGHRVLTDTQLRQRYDDALTLGDVRPEDVVVERMTAAPPSAGRLVDQVKSPGARPFVIRAQELVVAGDPKQAKLQIIMAMHLDPKNPALEAYAEELERALATKTSG